MIRAILTAVLLLAVAAPAIAETPPPTGLWLTEKEGVILRLYECGAGELCGRTVWLKKPNWKDGSPRLDAENPDPALRERPWCGIEVISGLKRESDDEWDGGKVYDPKTGDTFDFQLKRTDKGVRVRGYLGAPLLGKSEDWTPAPNDAVSFCDPV